MGFVLAVALPVVAALGAVRLIRYDNLAPARQRVEPLARFRFRHDRATR